MEGVVQGIFKKSIFCLDFYLNLYIMYYFQGLRSDLYNNLPAKIGLKIFSSVLNTSLSILAVR